MRLPPSPLHCKGGEGGGSPVPSAAGFFITGACLLGYLSLRARNGACKFAQVPFHFSGGSSSRVKGSLEIGRADCSGSLNLPAANSTEAVSETLRESC